MSLMPVDAITLITHQVSLFGPQHGMVEEGDKVAPDHLLRLHDRIGAPYRSLVIAAPPIHTVPLVDLPLDLPLVEDWEGQSGSGTTHSLLPTHARSACKTRRSYKLVHTEEMMVEVA